MKIAHISDLHVPSPHFNPKWGEYVVEKLNSLNLEAAIITGDLTVDGYPHEYEMAKEYIDRIAVSEKIIVPGNHDSRNRGYATFEEMFGTRFPYYENEKLVIVGLDSSEPDLDTGHIGRENYEMIHQKLATGGKLSIVALHHHLVPVPKTGRERNILVDAGEVLKILTEQADLVFSGHRHVPWIWNLENLYLVTAGTATSRRLRGPSYPSFNILEIEDHKVTLEEVNVSEKSTRSILEMDRFPNTLMKTGTQ